MPGYVNKCIRRFAPHLATHPPPKQHAPHDWAKPNYGAKTQFASPPDASPPLSKSAKTVVQEVVGTILYYARAINSTALVALGSIGTTIKTIREDTTGNRPPPQLRLHAPQCHSTLPHIQYDTPSPLGRQLLIGTRRPLPCRRILLPHRHTNSQHPPPSTGPYSSSPTL